MNNPVAVSPLPGVRIDIVQNIKPNKEKFTDEADDTVVAMTEHDRVTKNVGSVYDESGILNI